MSVVQFRLREKPTLSGLKRKPVVSTKKKTRELTMTEKADAQRLKAAWEEVQRLRQTNGTLHSKKHMAGLWGVHASNVSQYINGHIPLNVEAQLWFAHYLELSPTSIWPNFRFRNLVPGHLPPDAVDVAMTYLQLEDPAKNGLKQILQSLAKQSDR